MKPSWDWNKTGALIGLAALAFSILGYVRPADPAHPMSFDFMSKTVTLPAWQAFSIVIFIVLMTAALVYRSRRKPTVTTLNQPADKPRTILNPPHSLSSKITEASKPSADAHQAVQQKPLVLSSPAYNISVEIKEHTSKGNDGVAISVINNRLTRIGTTVLSVKSARSFDRRHNDYRDDGSFKAFATMTDRTIDPSCTGSLTWFIRRDKQNPNLLIGNDTQHELKWPNNDKSSDQQWKIGVEIVSEEMPKLSPFGPPVRFTALALEFVFVWNSDTNTFSFDRNSDAA